eukprot:3783002-Pyramimonas_sp.AAC.1
MPGRLGRIETAVRDHPCAPLWRRESATPAMPGRLGRIDTAVRDHPMRTPCGVEKVPRLLCLDDWG